jgi:hypothetical protein
LEAEFTTMNRPAATASYGRPKGTTNTSTHNFRKRVKLATKEASQEYKRVRDMLKAANQRAPRGSLTIILDLAKAKYNVKSANISQAKVCTRARRNNLDPICRGGTPSPMLPVEPYIVELVCQLGSMRCPINVKTGLQLANSIIAGTPYETQKIAWKKRHCAFACLAEQEKVASPLEGNQQTWLGLLEKLYEEEWASNQE